MFIHEVDLDEAVLSKLIRFFGRLDGCEQLLRVSPK